MGPLLEKFERDSIGVIAESIQNGYSLLKLEQKIRGLLPSFLSSRECRALIDAAVELFRAGRTSYSTNDPRGKALEDILTSTVLFRNYEHAINEVHYKIEKKAKAITVLEPIQRSRALKKVFYMVTIHQKPACGHKDYQGKIVIDRSWRSILSDDPDTLEVVRKYLKAHPTPRMQDLMKSPTLLSTRRNCRHRFIPLSVEEVTSKSAKELIAAHPEVHDHAHRSYTPAQLYQRKRTRIRNAKQSVKTSTSILVGKA